MDNSLIERTGKVWQYMEILVWDGTRFNSYDQLKRHIMNKFCLPEHTADNFLKRVNRTKTNILIGK